MLQFNEEEEEKEETYDEVNIRPFYRAHTFIHANTRLYIHPHTHTHRCI